MAGLIGSLALLGPAAATAAPTVVGTIPFPGGEPLAVAVYEAGNKVLVTEDNSGKLYILNGATHQILNTVDVGGSARDLVVNETHGKAYVGSDKDCCTTGANPGNGLISIVDLKSNQLISQFDPGPQGNVSYFALGNDEVADRVYFAYFSGLGMIDVATDQVTALQPPGELSPWAPARVEVNTATNTAYFDNYARNRLVMVHGATGTVEFLDLAPSGGFGPLDFEVNEVENKVYATMATVPGQGEIGILIHDRDTGSFKFVGADDLEPLAFNPASNTLFSGVQVGQRGALVDGATDALAPLELDERGGFAAADIRTSTDNAYFASDELTVVANGGNACSVKFATAPGAQGGLVASAVAANQATGRVYVNNVHDAGKVTVFQDSGPACVPPSPSDTSVAFALRAPSPQRVLARRAVRVRARCPGEPCGLAARGFVSIPGGTASARFRLRGTTRELAKGELAVLRLRLTKRLVRRLTTAFADRSTRRRVRARVSVVATDAARNTQTKTVSIRLRR
jgi:DNA-binding beta-propeller fold protein YncE